MAKTEREQALYTLLSQKVNLHGHAAPGSDVFAGTRHDPQAGVFIVPVPATFPREHIADALFTQREKLLRLGSSNPLINHLEVPQNIVFGALDRIALGKEFQTFLKSRRIDIIDVRPDAKNQQGMIIVMQVSKTSQFIADILGMQKSEFNNELVSGVPTKLLHVPVDKIRTALTQSAQPVGTVKVTQPPGTDKIGR